MGKLIIRCSENSLPTGLPVLQNVQEIVCGSGTSYRCCPRGSPSNSPAPIAYKVDQATTYVVAGGSPSSPPAVPPVYLPPPRDPLKPSPSPVPTLQPLQALLLQTLQKKNEPDRISSVDGSCRMCSNFCHRKFSYDELAKATKNFADEEKLGEGGFGAVYKGFLRDSGTNVAVKRVSRRSKQGIKEYESEVKIISRLRHKNLVKLIGWCHEKELLLAYEFMPNGSLDSHIFKGRSLLQWNLRYKIVQGLASALLYLHEEGRLTMKKGHEQLCWPGPWVTWLLSVIEQARQVRNQISDIYSFGVVALEIACGRRSIEPRYEEDRASLVAWVWQAYGNQRLLDVVDDQLSEAFDVKEIECLLITGLWCVHPVPSMRPSIKQAIQALNFEATLPNLPREMPIPKYDIANTPIIITSEPCLSNISITVPR
ncbi:hypothetical protein SLEP1_g35899 [Rubroshorea leprosula]|uniref:Protein kinase domain-containing protein n=1 Tax=Rubroshorea leprosula TaxID=152421 RepID=A0AAV5KPV4_9ROSI|nr:hypothetical protein SLEP1_g35899 [Rubroshorea leprosula]